MNHNRSEPHKPLESRLADRHAEGCETVSWRPLFFRLSREDDRRALADLLSNAGEGVPVFDTLTQQLCDLIKTRRPSDKFTSRELESLTRQHLGGTSAEEYGVWVYYPWSRRLIHLLDASEFAELRTNRNCYKITPLEQATLATKRVGIVGLSVGQSVATTLTLERACGELRLADFDRIDLSNLNRIRTGVHNLDLPKVYVTAREIAEIDPYLNITVFADGVTPENVEAFFIEGGMLDTVVEECDSLDIKILIRQHARAHRIPVVMETSDRGMLDIERFDLEPERPILHGLAGSLDVDSLGGLTTEQKLPYVLRLLGAETLSPRLRASMLEIDQTITTWPQLGSAVTHGGAVAADAVRRINLGESRPSGRFFLDLESPVPSGTIQEDSVVETGGVARRDRCTDPRVRDLVSQAILAPSGGNAQPWKWFAGPDQIRLCLDPARAAGLIDFEQAGAFVALGCAAENLTLAAHAAHLAIRIEAFPAGRDSPHAATFYLLGRGDASAEPHWRDELHAQIALRQTQRRIGAYRPLAPADQAALSEAVRSFPAADIQWLTERKDLAQIGELMGAADRIRFLNATCHRELYQELRWTREEAEATRDGLDVEALALSASDLAGLELCREWPTLALLREWGGGRNLEKMSRRYIAGASAVGLITMPHPRPVDYFNGGRALQRMWLVATERQLSLHPITALAYFFARLTRGGGSGFDADAIEELRRLRPIYEQLFRLGSCTAEVLLFCISTGDSLERRSLRRPIDEVLTAM